jgi:parvulin-like peptidyl-prolyl isomerase
VGAKTGQRDGATGRQRLGLILFGALLALLFIGFWVAEGIGSPDVPSGDVAIVEDAPDGLGQISQEEYDRAFEQQVAQAEGLKKAPKPGTKKYEELKTGALKELIEQIWIEGQAEELDITVTDKQVEDELETIIEQNFGSEKNYKKFLKESKFTQEDVDLRVRQQLLVAGIQENLNSQAPKPSDAEIENYYEAEKETQFTTKESRDVRLIINKDKGEVEAAKEILEKDSSPASWKKVAAKYSTDPTSKGKGGLQEGITEEFLKGELKAAVFDSATGELSGPVEFQGSYFVVEPVKLTPEKVQTLAESEAQIESTLGQEKQQEFFSEFVNDFQSKWRERTYCAEDYEIAACANFVGNGHPSNASPACYEADPKQPAEECPAPVTPTSPALPGSVTEQKPKGEPFPQRPLPESSVEEQGEEVPTEAPAGAPPAGE